jgi:Mor family transcriptional regulator
MESMEKWINEITVDEVPDKYKPLVDVIGIDNVIRMSIIFGGTNMYFPKSDMLVKSIRDKRIRREFNGGNYKELARKYNLSESQVRNIINYSKANARPIIPG